jgi:hypothetical protein
MRGGLSCAAALVPLLWISSAPADMQIRLYNSFGSTGGGEFDVDSVGSMAVPYVTNVTNAGHDFITFCVERTQNIAFGTSYDVVLNTSALSNNSFYGGPVDPLDPRTAYLFTQFEMGQLSNYNYNTSGVNGAGLTRETSANEFQKAVWYLENELTSATGQAAAWVTEANAAVAVGGSWYDQWGANSIGNVRVLNLYAVGHVGEESYGNQDQLVMIPAPAAAGLGALGLLIVGWVKRRKYNDEAHTA